MVVWYCTRRRHSPHTAHAPRAVVLRRDPGTLDDTLATLTKTKDCALHMHTETASLRQTPRHACSCRQAAATTKCSRTRMHMHAKIPWPWAHTSDVQHTHALPRSSGTITSHMVSDNTSGRHDVDTIDTTQLPPTQQHRMNNTAPPHHPQPERNGASCQLQQGAVSLWAFIKLASPVCARHPVRLHRQSQSASSPARRMSAARAHDWTLHDWTSGQACTAPSLWGRLSAWRQRLRSGTVNLGHSKLPQALWQKCTALSSASSSTPRRTLTLTLMLHPPSPSEDQVCLSRSWS